MTVLLFNHEGWEVATAAWSASAKPGKNVVVCYQWGADALSIFDSATGIRRVEFPMTMTKFLNIVGRNSGVADFRDFETS